MKFEEICLKIMKDWDIPQKLILKKETSDGICLKEEMYVGIKKPEFAFALFLHELAHAIQLKRHGDTGHDAIYADILTNLISIYCLSKQKVSDAIGESIEEERKGCMACEGYTISPEDTIAFKLSEVLGL